MRGFLYAREGDVYSGPSPGSCTPCVLWSLLLAAGGLSTSTAESQGPLPDRLVGAAGECCFFDFRTYLYYVL
jgi:hypothetical protein